MNKMGKGPGLKHFTHAFYLVLIDEATAHSTAKNHRIYPLYLCTIEENVHIYSGGLNQPNAATWPLLNRFEHKRR